MDFHSFIKAVSEAFTKPLPGPASQEKMSSMKRIRELMSLICPDPGKSIPSSVLLLLYPCRDQVFTVCIQRPDYGGVHSGQIGLPGGRQEPADPDLLTTALREAQEEIGVQPESVQILGKLTNLYIPPSRFLVTPFVGYVENRPDFMADPEEVDRIIELDLRQLFCPEACQITSRRVEFGIPFKAPSFVVDGQVIWGATAMILNEFKDLISDLL